MSSAPDYELRATVYARVSTGLQAEEGTSIDRQIEAGLRAAQELNARVVNIRKDEGASGALYYSRPAIQACIDDIRQGVSNILIVYRLDRQGRDYDVINRVEREVERYGGRIWYSGGINYDNTAIGRFQKNNEKNMAVFERDIIRERTVNGRRAKAEREGQQPSRAFRPYGYLVFTRADAIAGRCSPDQVGRYVLCEDEARWARLIFEQYAAGVSLRGICRTLEEAAVPTPRGGKAWTAATISGILDNPVYFGRPAYGRRQRRVDEERLHRTSRQTHRAMREYYLVERPEAEWVFLEAPPLVSKQVWDRCHERRRENIQQLGGNPERRFILSTLLRCPNCGRGMYGANARRTNKGRPYYRCTDYSTSSNSQRQVCNPVRYPSENLDRVVLEGMVQIAARPQEIDRAISAYRQHERQSGSVTEELRRLDTELTAVLAEQKAAVKAQIHGIRAGVDPSVYEEVFVELAGRRGALEQRLAALKSAARSSRNLCPSEQYAAVLQAVRDALLGDELSPAQKHAILATVVEGITPADESHLRVRLKRMPDSVNSIEVIQWFRRWDEASEAELGVPDNGERVMRTEALRRELPKS